MSLQNQYLGNTNYIAGATCLNTDAIVTIEEGYNLPGTIDSYSESNYDGSLGVLNIVGSAIGQSFTGDGRTVSSASFYLRKFGSPVGNVTVSIYKHSGVFGTSSVPVGTAIATSDVVSAANLTSSEELIPFTFSGSNKITLEYGVNYCISVNYDGNASDYVAVGFDSSSPTHSGNKFYYFGGWNAQSTMDTCFYLYGDIIYTKIGDYVLDDIVSSGEQNQRVTLNASHLLDHSSNHNQLLSLEVPSTVFYRTLFDDSTQFQTDFQSSDGCTVDSTGLRIILSGAAADKQVVLGKYQNLKNVDIFMKAKRSTMTSAANNIITTFRWQDETNYMYLSYEGGVVKLVDLTNNVPTVIATKTGVSVTANKDYYMRTVVFNDRVIHYGSTNGIAYTTHIDAKNIYGTSWAATAVMSNTDGLVGMRALGSSSATVTISDFRVNSLDDQQDSISAIKSVGAASGIFGVSAEYRFSDMTQLLISSGASWILTNNNALRTMNTNGSSWENLFTEGATYENFIAEFTANGGDGNIYGLAYGSSLDFHAFTYTLGTNTGRYELFEGSTRIASPITPVIAIPQVNKDVKHKLVKNADRLTWYYDGLPVHTYYGSTVTDIVNSPGGVGIIIWGATAQGITINIKDFRISTDTALVDLFVMYGYESPRQSMDRFVNKGINLKATSSGFDIVRYGASRGVFNITTKFFSPSKAKNYLGVPQLTSARSTEYISDNYANSRVNETNIASYVDDNIKSTKDAATLNNLLYQEEVQKLNVVNFSIPAIPTLEQYDKINIVDNTIGISLTYTVDSIEKVFDTNSLKENLTLTSDGG